MVNASAISAIALTTPGTVSTDNRFAEIPDAGVISGRVWLDADNDGVVDGSESGIAGQTIQLAGTDTQGNAVSRTTTTGADGSFAFSTLPPGTYVLTQPGAQPVVGSVTTLNGRTVAGPAGGTASAPGTTPSTIAGIALAAGATSTGHLFGEILPVGLSGINEGVVSGCRNMQALTRLDFLEGIAGHTTFQFPAKQNCHPDRLARRRRRSAA
jgi:hypothetical protein